MIRHLDSQPLSDDKRQVMDLMLLRPESERNYLAVQGTRRLCEARRDDDQLG